MSFKPFAIDPSSLETKWNKDKCNIHESEPFAAELFAMEPRIRTFSLAGNLADAYIGYIPTKQFIYLPVGLPTAQHELAHIMDVSMDRLTKIDFGFGSWDGFIHCGRKVASTFFQAAAKDNRAIAIENIMDGKDRTRFMRERNEPNCIWIDMAEKVLPFGRFRTVKDVLDWSQDTALKTMCEWDKDRIRTEWKMRLDHLRNWMETSDAN